MEENLGVQIDLRSDAVQVQGPEDGVARVQRVFQDFESLRRQGVNPHNGELNGMLRLVVADPATTLRSLVDSGKQRSAGIKRCVQPRSINQRKYVEAIEQNDMVFGVGPAGTGKTYLAVAMAVSAMNAKKVNRIVLVRPAVEAGEKLGFLPGSLQEKVDPYLRPLYDALYDLLDPEKVDKMLEKNVIEVAPLAFMRGRTLSELSSSWTKHRTHHRADEDVPDSHGQQLQSGDYRRHHADRPAQSAQIRLDRCDQRARRSGGHSLLPL
jgi:phosphate starvation-inducible PhoH-like protein